MATLPEDSSDTILFRLKRAIEGGQANNVQEYLEALYQFDLKNGSQSLKSNSGYELLRLCLQKKNNSTAKLLLQHGVEVNRLLAKAKSYSPLHLAVKNDDLEMVKLLLERGAETKLTSSNGKSPLYLAIELNYEDIAELLLVKDGLNINCDSHTVPIHAAASSGNEYLFNMLLTYGGRPNLKNFDNDSATMLQVAVEKSYVKTVEKLVKSNKVSKFIKEPGNEKLITVAVMNWRTSNKIVNALLQAKFPIDHKNAKNSEFICKALEEKYHSIVSELVKVGLDLDSYENVLQRAFEFNNIEVVEAVIHKVKDFDLKNVYGRKVNLLFYAIDNMHSVIKDVNSKGLVNSSEIFNKWFEIIKLLVNKGLNVNSRNSSSLTLLHHIADQAPINACLSLKPVVNFLISAGASTTMTYGSYSMTPLDYAISQENLDVVEVLLQYTSDVDSNKSKTSYLHYAAKNDSPAITEILLKQNADVNVIDTSGNTPLHVAALAGKINVMECLLKNKAKVNAKNFNSETPLHLAITHRWSDEKDTIVTQCIEILMKYKADIDAKDKDLMTPLHCAAKRSIYPTTIETLLEYKANIHSVNKAGLTPLLIAASFNNHSIISVLIKSGAKIDDRNKFGETALHLIVQRSSFPMSMMLKENFDINLLSFEKKTVLDSLLEAEQNYRYTSCLRENAHVLIEYMLKLHNIGVYICKENLQAIEKYLQAINANNSNTGKYNVIEFKEKCEKEAVLLKENKIGDTNMTFYKLFKKSTHRLAQYLLNKSILREIRLGKYSKMFPIYCELITKNLERGFERKKIFDQDVDGSIRTMLHNLPGNCIDEILSYLRNEDVQALITASAVKKESTNKIEPRMTRSRTVKRVKLHK